MTELKKIAHVMRRFSPDKWGGTEGVVFNLSRELERRGIASSIYCTDMLSRPGNDRMDTVHIRRFRYVFPWVGLSKEDKRKLELKGGSPFAPGLLVALLRERGLSVIHTHVQHRLGGMARTVARLKGIPLVVSLHGGYFTVPDSQIEKMRTPFRGKLEWGRVFGALLGSRRVLNDADAIVCVGRNEYDEVKRRYPLKNVFHVPNGVDVRRFSQAEGTLFREAYGFGPSEKIVLCVSRIDYQKNQLGLIRAFAAFAGSHPDHRLVLIGPVTVEDYRAELFQTVERLGIARKTKIMEGLRPDDPLLPSAYHAAEMLVLPSEHEPFGIVVLEAWAAGLPVIASRVGGVPGFATDGRNALLVEPGRIDELAARMAEMADDAALRATLSEAAFQEVSSRYDWENVADQLCGIYRKLMRR